MGRAIKGQTRPERFGPERPAGPTAAAGVRAIDRGGVKVELTGRFASSYNSVTRQRGSCQKIRLLRAGLDHAMPTTYYKRFRMEIELDGAINGADLPRTFVWVPWDDSLLDQHADVKYQSFLGEVDTWVFPCLGDRNGCRRLMNEIRRKSGFLPAATWLIAGAEGYVGTVQGVMDHGSIGAIQNVGVIRSYRGMGLGTALVRRALAGFWQAGLERAYLEVTAENRAAVQLYRNAGFRRAKTLYKAVGD